MGLEANRKPRNVRRSLLQSIHLLTATPRNANVTSTMLVGYITDVPEQEMLQIGSVNLDDSRVVSIRLAPNHSTNLVFLYQRNIVLTGIHLPGWSDTLRDSDDQPTSKIMSLYRKKIRTPTNPGGETPSGMLSGVDLSIPGCSATLTRRS